MAASCQASRCDLVALLCVVQTTTTTTTLSSAPLCLFDRPRLASVRAAKCMQGQQSCSQLQPGAAEGAPYHPPSTSPPASSSVPLVQGCTRASRLRPGVEQLGRRSQPPACALCLVYSPVIGEQHLRLNINTAHRARAHRTSHLALRTFLSSCMADQPRALDLDLDLDSP